MSSVRFVSTRVMLAAVLAVVAAPRCARAQSTRPTTNPNLPTLWLAGDSTVSNSNRDMVGWGNVIGARFNLSKINVINRGRGGRSSRTFHTEGLWDQLIHDARSGDYVLIQFGHNDGGPIDDAQRARGSLPGIGEESREIDNPVTKKHEVVHTYGWYLRKFIADARAKGITPILLSPVPRVPRSPVSGPATAPTGGHNLWVAQVAAEQGVEFIDLHNLVMNRYIGLTPEQIKGQYFVAADNTHTSRAGAELNADCVVEGLRTLKDSTLATALSAP